MLWAAMEAMRRAVLALSVEPDVLLIDGNRAIPDAPCVQETVVRGDGISLSIAAASVVAKVTRDRLMTALDADVPATDSRSTRATRRLSTTPRSPPTARARTTD